MVANHIRLAKAICAKQGHSWNRANIGRRRCNRCHISEGRLR